MARRGIGRLKGGGSGTVYRGLTGAFNYVVDKTNGNDANPGTPASPFKTLSKIVAGLTSSGQLTRVLVKAGTYNTSLDSVFITNAAAGCILEIVFEPGCIMDGTAANAIVETNGFEFNGAADYSSVIYGNGLQVNNYSEPTANSPNGVGNRNNHVLYVYDVICSNCDDGFSAHDNATLYLYDCAASGGEKSAFAHIGTSRTFHYRCSFTGKIGASLGIGAVASDTAVGYFEDCQFIPTANNQLLSLTNSTVIRSRVGTTTLSAQLTTTSGASPAPTITKSYVNAFVDGNSNATLSQCFGLFTVRLRSGATQSITNSVFTGPASGHSGIVEYTSVLGAQTLTFNNNICKTASAPAFMFGVDAVVAPQMVAAAQKFWNNALNGSAAYDADLIAADSGGAVIKSTLSTDVGIGSPTGTLMGTYAYPAGSAAIGAGTSGSNIGYGQIDVLELRARTPALP